MEEQSKRLYADILELIEFRGIKQGKIAEVMKMSYNNWYKSRQDNLRNISLSDIGELAEFLNLPAEQVFSLCFEVYRRDRNKRDAGTTPKNTPPAPLS
jgi:transcriptional regulator with XRE-family HTH domain